MRTLGTILIALTLSLLTMAPAHADGYPPPFGDTGTTTPTPGNPGGQPGGGGTPPPAPEGRHWVYGGFPVTPPTFNGYQSFGADGYTMAWRCDPKDVDNGDGDWLPTGVAYSHLVITDSGAFGGDFSYSCLYPPRPQDAIATCYPWLKARIDREVLAPAENLTNERVNTVWSSNRTSPEACATSSRIATNARLRKLGGYEVEVEARALRCTVRSYPGSDRATRVVLPCGNPTDSTKAAKGAVWCDNGVKWAFGPNSWAGKTFDWAKCTGTDDEIIQCTPATQQPTIKGHVTTRRNPREVLDSNDPILIKHAPLTVEGVRNLRDIAARMDYVSGEPMRSDLSDNDPTQPVYLNDARFGQWVQGDITTWDLRVAAPGVEGDPLTVQRDIKFTGTIDAQTVTITGIDFETMEMTTSTTTVPMTVTSMCSSPEVYVAPYRARSSN